MHDLTVLIARNALGAWGVEEQLNQLYSCRRPWTRAKPALKPPINAGDHDQWRRDIEALARHRNVCCKLSGLVTEAAWRQWQPADFRPVLDVALQAFGPERLMFGSDWPVCLLSADYAEVTGIIRDFIAPLSPAEQGQIWGGTATRFYGLT